VAERGVRFFGSDPIHFFLFVCQDAIFKKFSSDRKVFRFLAVSALFFYRDPQICGFW